MTSAPTLGVEREWGRASSTGTPPALHAVNTMLSLQDKHGLTMSNFDRAGYRVFRGKFVNLRKNCAIYGRKRKEIQFTL